MDGVLRKIQKEWMIWRVLPWQAGNLNICTPSQFDSRGWWSAGERVGAAEEEVSSQMFLSTVGGINVRFRFNNFTRNKSDIKNQSPLGSPLWFGSTPHFTQEPGCISGFYNPWWQESHKVGLTGVYGGIWWICISAVYGWKQATWKNAEFLVVDHHPFYGL